MQWTAGPNAGFTLPSSTPWMKVHPNHKDINVEAQTADPDSVFHCWRAVLATRKHHRDIFVYGDFDLFDAPHDKVLAYTRRASSRSGPGRGHMALVAGNFSDQPVEWHAMKGMAVREVLVSSGGKQVGDFARDAVTLGPYEGFAILLE